MSVIANLDILLSAKLDNFTAPLDQAKNQVSDFQSTTENASGSIADSLGSVMAGGAGLATTAFAGLAAGAIAAGAAIVSLTVDAFGHIDALNETAQKIGVSTEALSGLEFACKMNGAEFSTLTSAMQKFNVKTSQAATQGKGCAEAFQALGLNAKELNAMPTEQRLGVVADALNRVTNANDRARLGTEILGKGYADLQILLSGGSAGLKEATDEATRLGVTFDQGAADAVASANDAIDAMFSAVSGIGIALAPLVAPVVQSIAEWLTEATVQVRGFFVTFSDVFTQLGNVLMAWAGVCAQVWSMVGQGLASLWVSVFGGEATFESFRDSTLSALIAVEFGIQNMGRVWDISIASAALSITTFAADTANFFTSVLPQTFMSFGSIAMSFFTGLWENIRNGFTSLWQFVSGQTVTFDWTPLDKGATEALNKIAKSFERSDWEVEKALKSDLDKKVQSYSDDYGKFFDERMKSFGDTGKKQADQVKQAVGDAIEIKPKDVKAKAEHKVKVEKVESPAAVEKGSAEAQKLINDFLRGNEDGFEKEADKDRKKMVAVLEDIKGELEDADIFETADID